MQELILTVHQLQEVFNIVGAGAIQLPQIVVVGAQSSGKSSVLESIVGTSFLPRGTGIITRRPLIIQLINHPTDSGEEYAEFTHKPGNKFQDADGICREILNETDREAGTQSKGGISAKPILMKYYSPKVLNLTLVDLPGLTKVPVGDQPEDIEARILEMVKEYVDNPNSIILAITAANTDIATSESLKIARKVDAEAERTVLVVTKLDLMDKGTNAIDKLRGEGVRVKCPIIGVVSRSQTDIVNGKSIEDQLKTEIEFLRRFYPKAADKHGTPVLR